MTQYGKEETGLELIHLLTLQDHAVDKELLKEVDGAPEGFTSRN